MPVEPESSSVAELAADDARLIERFIERIWAEDGLADRTLEAYRQDLQGLARWLGTRGRSLSTAGREDISAYHGSQPVAVRSMARRQSAFRRFFAQIARDDGTREDPTLLMQRPRMPRSLPKALAEREIEALIVAPDLGSPLGQRDRAMLELMYSSGLRVSEIDTRIHRREGASELRRREVRKIAYPRFLQPGLQRASKLVRSEVAGH